MEIVADRLLSWIPDVSVLLLACLAQTVAVITAMWAQRVRARQRALFLSLAVSSAAMALGLLLRSDFLLGTIRGPWVAWLRSLLFAWTLLSLVWAIGFLLIRAIGPLPRGARVGSPFNAARRGFLGTAYSVLFAAPAATLAY